MRETKGRNNIKINKIQKCLGLIGIIRLREGRGLSKERKEEVVMNRKRERKRKGDEALTKERRMRRSGRKEMVKKRTGRRKSGKEKRKSKYPN